LSCYRKIPIVRRGYWKTLVKPAVDARARVRVEDRLGLLDEAVKAFNEPRRGPVGRDFIG
jgi:hypothetical protein